MASASSADLTPRRNLGALASVAAVVILVDQLTKWWAVDVLGDGDIVDLVWTFRLRLVRNDGAAFGLGTGLTIFITLAAIVISIAVVVVAWRSPRRSVAATLGFVLGGAIGNVIDRIVRSGDGPLRGAVIDFFDLQWWPVFNVADMAIVLGGIALVFMMSGEPDDEPAAPEAAVGVAAATSSGADDDS